jgi:hypothetical protein
MLFNISLISAFMIRNIIYLTLEAKDIISLVNITTLVERSNVIYIINLMLLVLREYINMVTS